MFYFSTWPHNYKYHLNYNYTLDKTRTTNVDSPRQAKCDSTIPFEQFERTIWFLNSLECPRQALWLREGQ